MKTQKGDLKALDKAREQARPCTMMHAASQYGCVFFEGRRELDLHPVVVAVTLPQLLTLVGQLLGGMIAPVIAGIPVAKLNEPIADVMKRLEGMNTHGH